MHAAQNAAYRGGGGRRGARLRLRRAVPQAAGLSLYGQALDLRSQRPSAARRRPPADVGADRFLRRGGLSPDDRLYRRRQQSLARHPRALRLPAGRLSAAGRLQVRPLDGYGDGAALARPRGPRRRRKPEGRAAIPAAGLWSALAMRRAFRSETALVPHLDAVVSEIADDMREAHRSRRGRDLYPRTRARRPLRASAWPWSTPRATSPRRRLRDSVFDPEHFEGVHPDAGARHGRRPAMAPGRARALRQPVQFDRATGARARQAAQSLHQRRRDRGHRRHPVRPSAARGDRRDPALPALSRRRLPRSRSTRRSRRRSSAPAFAMSRSPIT